jgi:cobaltochelatase CobT
VEAFHTEFHAERIKFAAASGKLVRDLQGRFSEKELHASVVSFLIDHSGSMRGLRMISALLAIEAAVDALANAQIDSEVLGFTTVSWRGGQARRAWQMAGAHRNPGRLCDLRHIIYKSADAQPSTMPHLSLALRSDLLRENVDGEALEWAASRLDPAKWDRRIICLISDGTPVDDSTLFANDDPAVLWKHLEVTKKRVRSRGITVGVLRFFSGLPPTISVLEEEASEPESAGLSLLRLVQRAFISPPADS